MRVVSSDFVEFRFCKSSVSRTGNGTNYYYTFEDDNNSFQCFSRVDFNTRIKKGDRVKLVFDTRLWDDKLQFNLADIISDK